MIVLDVLSFQRWPWPKTISSKGIENWRVFFPVGREKDIKLPIFLQKKKEIGVTAYICKVLNLISKAFIPEMNLIFVATKFWLCLFGVSENSNLMGLLFLFSCLFLVLFLFSSFFYHASLLCVCKRTLWARCLLSSWGLIPDSPDTWNYDTHLPQLVGTGWQDGGYTSRDVKGIFLRKRCRLYGDWDDGKIQESFKDIPQMT